MTTMWTYVLTRCTCSRHSSASLALRSSMNNLSRYKNIKHFLNTQLITYIICKQCNKNPKLEYMLHDKNIINIIIQYDMKKPLVLQ